MIDHGGNGDGNGHGMGGINRFAQTGPTLIFALLQQLQSLGLSMPEVMAQLGIKPNGGVEEPPNAQTPNVITTTATTVNAESDGRKEVKE